VHGVTLIKRGVRKVKKKKGKKPGGEERYMQNRFLCGFEESRQETRSDTRLYEILSFLVSDGSNTDEIC